jgi:predicted nucleotidyltransferase
MKIYGTIMEINPFHNGHKYFLSKIPKTDSDLLIVVVSTTIVQRGEISVLSKDIKTQLLLDHNVDIVIELPSLLANQGGLHFAKHAINLLKEFNITHLCFGSEQNNLELLKEFIKKPQTYDFANGIHKEYLSNLQSNDILGISYLKAIGELDIEPFLIKRIESNYNDLTIQDSQIQSATAIRNAINHGEDVSNYLPELSFKNIKTIDEKVLFQIFKTNLYNALDNKINIFLAEENQLLNKMAKIMHRKNVNSIDELVLLCRDKNNSKFKFKRVIMNTILMIKADSFNELDYIHVLGFTENGRKYCKQLDNKKIITSFKKVNSEIALCELRASRLAVCVGDFKPNLDFQQPSIK